MIRSWDDLSDSEKLDVILSIINIVAGIIMLVGGIYLLFDDVEDFGSNDHGGKFLDSLPWPLNIIREHIHHWHWGLILIILGLLIDFIGFLKIVVIFVPEARDNVLGFIRNIESSIDRVKYVYSKYYRTKYI